ncbi:MAG: DUF6046 domain-containing protein [Bacteroidales bacterium]
MINLRLMPATIATAGKYFISALRVERLPPNRSGSEDEAELLSQQNAEMPYPLVSGNDLYGRSLIVPLYLRSTSDEIYFPEAVVSVSRARNIVTTPVLNGRGTVKELITDGDIELSLSLAVVSTADDGSYDAPAASAADVYPYKGVERLRKLLDTPERLDVVSDFLALFDLDGGDFGIVIKNYKVQQDTHLNRQVFEVEALSDYDYDLLIKD